LIVYPPYLIFQSLLRCPILSRTVPYSSLFRSVDLKGRVSSEIFADLVPGARVVKAFNHLRAEVLASDPRAEGGRRVLFYSGNDEDRKSTSIVSHQELMSYAVCYVTTVCLIL